MLSCSLRQILTLPSECCSRNQDSSDQATLSNLLLSTIWSPSFYSEEVYSQVEDIQNRHADPPRSGRPRKFTPRSNRVTLREMKDNPITSPQTLQASNLHEPKYSRVKCEAIRPTKLGQKWVMLQDNDPKHPIKSTIEWLWSLSRDCTTFTLHDLINF